MNTISIQDRWQWWENKRMKLRCHALPVKHPNVTMWPGCTCASVYQLFIDYEGTSKIPQETSKVWFLSEAVLIHAATGFLLILDSQVVGFPRHFSQHRIFDWPLITSRWETHWSITVKHNMVIYTWTKDSSTASLTGSSGIHFLHLLPSALRIKSFVEIQKVNIPQSNSTLIKITFDKHMSRNYDLGFNGFSFFFFFSCLLITSLYLLKPRCWHPISKKEISLLSTSDQL